MARVPLTGGAYQARSLIAAAQKCVNLFPENNPEPDSQSPVRTTHYPTPGLRFLGCPSDQPGTPDPIPVPAAARSSHVDGASELDLNAPLSGVSDSPFLTMSVWLKPAAPPTNGTDVAVGGNTFAELLYGDPGDATAQWALPVVNNGSSAEIIPEFNVGNGVAFAANWHNILIAVDTNHGTGSKVVHAYVDDVAQVITVNDVWPAFDISFADPTAIETFIGGQSGIGYTGDIYSIWYAPGVFIDLTVEANRRKFISALGAVVDLGTDGSIPTGTAPAVYFKGGPAAFVTNLGTGGAFSLTGDALTGAATNPPGV